MDMSLIWLERNTKGDSIKVYQNLLSNGLLIYVLVLMVQKKSKNEHQKCKTSHEWDKLPSLLGADQISEAIHTFNPVFTSNVNDMFLQSQACK